MCSYFIVGNKFFCFFKKWVFCFLDKDTFEGGSEVLQKFEGRVACNWEWGGGGEGGLADLELFLGGI